MRTMEYDLGRERQAGLLREAANERIARRLRADDRRSRAPRCLLRSFHAHSSLILP